MGQVWDDHTVLASACLAVRDALNYHQQDDTVPDPREVYASALMMIAQTNPVARLDERIKRTVDTIIKNFYKDL